MGFSFLSFGRRGKKPEVPALQAQQKRTLRAEDLSKWLQSEFSGKMDEERKSFSSVSHDLLTHISSLRGNVESIRDKQFGKGESYYAAVNMIKDTWAKKTLAGIQAYQAEFRQVPQDAGFTYYNGLYKATLKLTNEACVHPKQQTVLKQFFEDESRRLAETLRALGLSMDSLGGLVRGAGALKAQAGTLSLMAELSEAQEGAAGIKTGISALSSEIEKKAGEISGMERDMSGISSSPDWKEIERLEKDRAAGIRERDGIEADISSRMGSLKRPLKLFAHDAEGLSKDEKQLAESLSHSPVKAILSSDAGAVEKLLSKALAGAKSMGLPEKDAARLQEIEPLISTGWARKVSGRYALLSKRIEDDWSRIKGIDIVTRKVHAERVMERAHIELEALGKQREALEAKLSGQEGKIAEKKREIADLIRKELSREVEVS